MVPKLDGSVSKDGNEDESSEDVEPDKSGAPMNFSSQRDDLLRRFGLPTCKEMRTRVERDNLTDEMKLDVIKGYGPGRASILPAIQPAGTVSTGDGGDQGHG